MSCARGWGPNSWQQLSACCAGPQRPNCTYGFTDGIVKTGELLFTSLLYVDASRQMAALAEAHGCGDGGRYRREAARVGASIDRMKDGNSSLWLAASHEGALPDVWGSGECASDKGRLSLWLLSRL